MTIFRIHQYNSNDKQDWDNFVASSKNGVFLFYRDYMDYHSDRFEDHSLMIYKNEKLIALLPASVSGDTITSHGGLTFGSFITNKKIRAAMMLEMLPEVMVYFRHLKLKKLIYKAIPYIFHQQPADEDLFALYKMNAKQIKCEVSSCIDLANSYSESKDVRREIKAAKKNNFTIKESKEFATFMKLLNNRLEEKYDAKAVHTSEEIIKLQQKFPDNIKLYTVHHHEDMIAGTIIFENKNIAHTQYIASNKLARENGGLSLLYQKLIREVYADKRYFNFGTSMLNRGQELREGLVFHKEKFGARTVCYSTYEIDL